MFPTLNWKTRSWQNQNDHSLAQFIHRFSKKCIECCEPWVQSALKIMPKRFTVQTPQLLNDFEWLFPLLSIENNHRRMLRSLWLSQVEHATTIKPKCFSLHWIIILEKDWQEVCGPLALLSKHNHILCLAAETAVCKPCHSAPWSLGLPSWTWFLVQHQPYICWLSGTSVACWLLSPSNSWCLQCDMICPDSTSTAHWLFPSLVHSTADEATSYQWFLCIWAKEINLHSSFLVAAG